MYLFKYLNSNKSFKVSKLYLYLPEQGHCLAEANIMVIEIAETKECGCREHKNTSFSQLDLSITMDIVGKNLTNPPAEGETYWRVFTSFKNT